MHALAVAAILALVSALAPAPARAELEPWDQEKVTALATQLAPAVREARRAVQRDPASPDRSNPGMRRYLDAVRRVETSSGRLATALQNGQGREQTQRTAELLRQHVRDAELRGAQVPTSRRSEVKIEPVKVLLDQLAPFWFEEPRQLAPPPA